MDEAPGAHREVLDVQQASFIVDSSRPGPSVRCTSIAAPMISLVSSFTPFISAPSAVSAVNIEPNVATRPGPNCGDVFTAEHAEIAEIMLEAH